MLALHQEYDTWSLWYYINQIFKKILGPFQEMLNNMEHD